MLPAKEGLELCRRSVREREREEAVSASCEAVRICELRSSEKSCEAAREKKTSCEAVRICELRSSEKSCEAARELRGVWGGLVSPPGGA